jgi:hypothetical protein
MKESICQSVKNPEGGICRPCVDPQMFGKKRSQPPFFGDITDFPLSGWYRIEIKIVNLWPNRLTGDGILPENERFTQTNVPTFTGENPLHPSGQAGPVGLIFVSGKFA